MTNHPALLQSWIELSTSARNAFPHSHHHLTLAEVHSLLACIANVWEHPLQEMSVNSRTLAITSLWLREGTSPSGSYAILVFPCRFTPHRCKKDQCRWYVWACPKPVLDFPNGFSLTVVFKALQADCSRIIFQSYCYTPLKTQVLNYIRVHVSFCTCL